MPRLHGIVIASEAKQSIFDAAQRRHGLLRRFAPRNDDPRPAPERAVIYRPWGAPFFGGGDCFQRIAAQVFVAGTRPAGRRGGRRPWARLDSWGTSRAARPALERLTWAESRRSERSRRTAALRTLRPPTVYAVVLDSRRQAGVTLLATMDRKRSLASVGRYAPDSNTDCGFEDETNHSSTLGQSRREKQ